MHVGTEENCLIGKVSNFDLYTSRSTYLNMYFYKKKIL